MMRPVSLPVLVVIPALNEEDSVADVVRDVMRAIPAAHCLVIDDGSIDDTGRAAKAAGADVLRLPFNLGVGGAMRAGFRHARAYGYGVVVQVDADGQHDPAAIAEMIEGLANADLVIGARFAGLGDYGVRGPRKWAMKMLAAVMSRVARTRLTDVTSGFKASGPRAIELFAEEFPAEYLGDTIEALVIAARAGLHIQQVPVQMRERQGGEPSHSPVRAAVYLVRACAAFALAMLRPRAHVGGNA
ncbi:glycosyltransferase family 2 protein [Microbacterium esteraromaticum]|uniref:Glycosyltransferase family 2 protein n=1 Tax=Microbacterium esteraromaticum TaxID=57043 RepID=A0A939IV45_9MICO|nr:glycosyltransferase family 2 protein [Microbacterium esteraromaticum]MBN8205689.1 glycosyltransferase family 2 protein [Microbacterium esteraromaticum]MBN8415843.1 glycosyltransferase family 2 protein [Microbacterium esteraromaticum]